MPLKPDIFLSYGHTDAPVARRFAEGFERAGFSVWWDATLHSGDSFDAAIEAALRSAKAVVVLWSAASVQSRWVRAEATLADRLNTLIPVMIEACERPIMFELTQTASLVHWSGDDADGEWRSLLADVRRLLDKVTDTSPNVGTAAASPVAVPERGSEPGVAMLPIGSRSGLPEDEAFAQDMVPEIVGELSRHGYSRVITPVATAGHRDAKVDVRVLARELDVRYLIESHTRRVGANLRLMVQLTEAHSGNIVWSHKYERPVLQLAQLQDELAVLVASQIGEQILRLEFEHVYRKSGNWTAWERVLRSMANMANGNSDGMRPAIEEARQALRMAPDYAFAHSQLAIPLAVDGITLANGEEAAVKAEVRAHVKRALELAPLDSRVLQGAANALSHIGDFHGGLRLAERAVELTPNVAHAHQCVALAYLGLGRCEEAIAELDAEEHLAPHDGVRFVSYSIRGKAWFALGDLASAEAALDRSLKLSSAFVWTLKWKAIVASMLGRPAEAMQLVHELRVLEPQISLARHQAHNSMWIANQDRAHEANQVLGVVWAQTEAQLHAKQ